MQNKYTKKFDKSASNDARFLSDLLTYLAKKQQVMGCYEYGNNFNGKPVTDEQAKELASEAHGLFLLINHLNVSISNDDSDNFLKAYKKHISDVTK